MKKHSYVSTEYFEQTNSNHINFKNFKVDLFNKIIRKGKLNEITPKLIPYLNFHEKKRKNINCSWNYSSNNFNIAINIESVMGLIQ